MNVLVVYATKHGSTQQVAEVVAHTMRKHGATVAACPASDVRGPVGNRDLVVVGGALYSGRWHRDAHRFLKRHRRELAGMPVAVFGMGPRSDEERAWDMSRAQLDRALAKQAWLRPASVAVFGGVDPAPRHDRPPRDLRDWAIIRHWSRQLLAPVPLRSQTDRNGS